MKPFTIVSNEIFMDFNFQEAAVKPFDFLFQMKYKWFWNLQEVVVKP